LWEGVFENCSMDHIDNWIARLDDTQRVFKNAYALIIGPESFELSSMLQLEVHGGTLRFLHCPDYRSATSLIMTTYTALRDTAKLGLQKQFFEREETKLLEARTAKAVTLELLKGRGFSEDDAQLMVEGFPKIHTLLTASPEMLLTNSPVDSMHIDSLLRFMATEDGK
jgi:hypothetical protein